MPTIVPESYGVELAEIGWTDQARQAALRARLAMAANKSKPVKRSSSGGGQAASTGQPRATGERQNDAGERVLDYTDGSTVTVHGDGSATYRTSAGQEVRGTYKDPAPKKTTPTGFTSDDDPAVVARKRREAEGALKKTDAYKKAAQAERARQKTAAYRSAVRATKAEIGRATRRAKARAKV